MPTNDWWTTPKAFVWLWGLVTLVGITGGVSDIWIARWAESGQSRWLLSASAICVFSLWLFGWLIKTDSRSLSHLLMLATLTHVLQVVVYEIAIRGHRPSRLEFAGLLLGLVALMLLEWQSQDMTVAKAGDADREPRAVVAIPGTVDQTERAANPVPGPPPSR